MMTNLVAHYLTRSNQEPCGYERILSSSRSSLPLFRSSLCNDAAGDSIAGITGRIGDIVVSGKMNNDRASIGIKDRRVSGAERNAVHQHLISSLAVFDDVHVWKITCVRTGGIF